MTPVVVFVWACALLLAGSCSEARTYGHLTVIVDAEGGVRASARQIVVMSPSSQRTFALPRANAWPVVFTAFGDAGERGALSITAEGEEGMVVSRAINVTFPSGRRVLSVLLSDACRSAPACGARDLTCGDCGRCVALAIDGSSLPPVASEAEALRHHRVTPCVEDGSGPAAEGGSFMEGGPPEDGAVGPADAGPDAAPTDDAGREVDAGVLDAAVPDAGGPAITVSAPPVVARESCIRVDITRTGGSLAAASALVSATLGSLYDSDSCSSTVSQVDFAERQQQARLYYRAPQHHHDQKHFGRATVTVALEDVSGETAIDVRTRALGVSRGHYFGCALLATWNEGVGGDVQCAGLGSDDRLGAPARLVDVRATPLRAQWGGSRDTTMLGDGANTCLLTYGGLECFGDSEGLGIDTDQDQTVAAIPTGLGSVRQADLGDRSGCAVGMFEPELYCWGRNAASQCATGTDVVRTPVLVTRLEEQGITSESVTVSECGAGDSFLCARVSDGSVHCWGEGYTGVEEMIAADATLLAAGRNTACAAIDTGQSDSVSCWTAGGSRRTIQGLPTGRVEQLVTNADVACAAVAGALYCWGSNVAGWLGTTTKTHPLHRATRVALPEGELGQVAIGWSDGPTFSAIVDGLVYSWGVARWGALGVDERVLRVSVPTAVPALMGLPIDTLSIGGETTCAILEDRTVRCWGISPGTGVVGFEQGMFSDTPVAPVGLPGDIIQVVAGEGHVFALRDPGVADELYAWGLNNSDQLGGGNSFNDGYAYVPQRATAVEAPSSPILQVSTRAFGTYSQYNGCARYADGSVRCWGAWPDDDAVVEGTAEVVPSGSNTTDLTSSCALIEGVAECWDDDSWTRTVASSLPSGLTDIDASRDVICGRSATTSLCFWAAPQTTSGWGSASASAAGEGFACEISAVDSTVSCRGDNSFGQIGLGTFTADSFGQVVGLGPVDRLAVGPWFSCARAAGVWKCWGGNRNGNMGVTPYVYDRPTLMAPWGEW